jgi:hypothetical protein
MKKNVLKRFVISTLDAGFLKADIFIQFLVLYPKSNVSFIGNLL